MRYAGILALCLTVCGGAAYASQDGGPMAEVTALVQQGTALSAGHDYVGAIKVLNQAVAADAFQALPVTVQHNALRTLELSLLATRDYQATKRICLQTTASAQADLVDWRICMLASQALGDNEGASLALLKLAEMGADPVGPIRITAVISIMTAVDTSAEGHARNVKFMRALFAAHWRPATEPPEFADGLWEWLAREDLKAGDLADAQRVSAAILDADALVRILANKWFDPVVRADPAHFDVVKAYAAEVDRYQARMVRLPDHLDAIVLGADALYHLDRQAEALALIDGAIAQVAAGKKYVDAEFYANWLYDRRAQVLFALGRTDAAFASLEAGTHQGENGIADSNVSQIINLAADYCAFGRPKDALSRLAALNPKRVAPYGALVVEKVRACANTQLGDSSALDDSVSYARAHAGDGPEQAVEILLYAGLDDEAAKIAVKYLADDNKRNRLLGALHNWVVPAKKSATPFAAQIHARWTAFGKRPDVVKAVEEFGHILNLPIVQ